MFHLTINKQLRIFFHWNYFLCYLKTNNVCKGHEGQFLQGHLEQDVDVRLRVRDVDILINETKSFVIAGSA